MIKIRYQHLLLPDKLWGKLSTTLQSQQALKYERGIIFVSKQHPASNKKTAQIHHTPASLSPSRIWISHISHHTLSSAQRKISPRWDERGKKGRKKACPIICNSVVVVVVEMHVWPHRQLGSGESLTNSCVWKLSFGVERKICFELRLFGIYA